MHWMNSITTHRLSSSWMRSPPSAKRMRRRCSNMAFHTPISNSCKRSMTSNRKKLTSNLSRHPEKVFCRENDGHLHQTWLDEIPLSAHKICHWDVVVLGPHLHQHLAGRSGYAPHRYGAVDDHYPCEPYGLDISCPVSSPSGQSPLSWWGSMDKRKSQGTWFLTTVPWLMLDLLCWEGSEARTFQDSRPHMRKTGGRLCKMPSAQRMTMPFSYTSINWSLGRRSQMAWKSSLLQCVRISFVGASP